MIIVTGVKGQLGYDVVKELNRRNIVCKGIDIDELDITDCTAVLEYMRAEKPEAVIHCAAYNSVDEAELDNDNCNAVNLYGTKNIVSACKMVNAKMMFFSTDYVFSGAKNGEYEINDIKDPLNVYGKSKSDAEEYVINNMEKYFILRISWLFGINGYNFVTKMLQLSETKAEIAVVSDQIGSPTYTRDLAKLVCDMIITEKYGVYHATNEGFCSWLEFASEIIKVSNQSISIKPVLSSDYKSQANRPLNSRLSKKSLDSAGFLRLRSWEEALHDYLEELKEI